MSQYSWLLTALVVVCLSCCAQSKNLTRTLVTDNIQSTGAVCLDGSPPGYLMRKGSGTGAKKFVLHLMGGGWCSNLKECYNRTTTIFGSSTHWPESYQLFGIFSDDPSVNPDFYNWNAVFLMYCDGGSFAGDQEEPAVYNGTKLYFRGYRILKALLKQIIEKEGLSEATDVILTGCSAGGLSVYLHADFVKTVLPKTVTTYKAFADAGYFIDIPNVNGSDAFPESFSSLMKMQNIDEAVIPACKAQYSGTDMPKCLFAPYIYNFIKAPLFVLNSQYDAVVLNTSYLQPCMPPHCSKEGEASLRNYEKVFNKQIIPVITSPKTNGYFLDSCFVHCQTFQVDKVWSDYAIRGRTIARTFGDWYFERSHDTRLKDCEDFPCNPTCSKVPPHEGKLPEIVI